jgi:hypothetical protein
VKKLILFAFMGWFLSSCSFRDDKGFNNEIVNTLNNPVHVKEESANIKSDTTFVLKGDTVSILFPTTPVRGQILVLPGWNFSRNKCCKESSFCKKALEKGYVLVLPEMGKSIYASAVYAETRKDWFGYPQLKWVTDTLIQFLQMQAGLFKPGQSNYIFGISTGGRGVALIAEHAAKLFKAGASLSGDYDQRLQPSDNLMKGFYGDYTSFKSRWEGEDNALLNASKVLIPVYLGHGLDDKIVSVKQTELFYKELKKINPQLQHQLHLAKAQGHNYAYWDSETDAVLNFFEEN